LIAFSTASAPELKKAARAGEVEQSVAVDVGHDGAQRRVDDDRSLDGNGGSDDRALSRHDLARTRAGDRGR
jgi:hypothetical protein